MKTYEVIQLVEMTIKHSITAENAEAANQLALDRTQRTIDSLRKRQKNIDFGDITDDYVPARDD